MSDSVPTKEDYIVADDSVRAIMLSEARQRVGSTWDAADSLDSKSSSLLATTAALAAAAFGALGFSLNDNKLELTFGAIAAMLPFVVGTALAAIASRGGKFKPPNFEGVAIAKDFLIHKKDLARIECELAYYFDQHSNQNQASNKWRARLVTLVALTVPGGIVLGLTVWVVARLLLQSS